VFAIPATIQLAGAEVDMVTVDGREHLLKSLLSPINEHFDYVLIDCPPSLGLLTINALVAADELLIPIQCEFYALEGVTKLLESMRMVKNRLNPELEIFGVLLTMYDARTTLSKQVAEEVTAYFGKKVFKTIIPRNVKLSEAPSHGLPVTQYARMSRGAQAYIKLSKEVIRRG
jgi:chromosome partitioning protein